MSNKQRATREWRTRPPEERFLSLSEMFQIMSDRQAASRNVIAGKRQIRFAPAEEDFQSGLLVGSRSKKKPATIPSNWAFGQLCQRVGAPAAYLRTLPSPLVADQLNWLYGSKDDEEIGFLIRRNGSSDINPFDNSWSLQAATGPRYGRIWNKDVVASLIDMVGVGDTWRVPGEFGKRVEVTRQNTTLYAGDRDMFVFLADEDRRIEVPARRHGQTGSLARGFYVWNSEVGSATCGVAFFLFDYTCSNRIVWGQEQFTELSIRHSAGAPGKWREELLPRLIDYSESSQAPVRKAIEDARSHVLPDATEFLATRFGPRIVEAMEEKHLEEEERVIETRWDAITAATAYARSIPWQADRLQIERVAGTLLTGK